LDHSQALSKNMEHVAFARLARDSAFELILTLVLLFGVVSIVRWVIGPSPISRAMWRFGVFPATGIVPYAIAQLLGSIVGVVAARAVWTDGGLSMYPESNRLDRMEALRLWTVGSSWFSGEGGKKGAIVPGQLADLAVLSSDYFSVPEEEIKGLESVLTVVGGKAVYAADEFAELSPPVPPVLPDWSPVAGYGGYAKPALAPASARSSVALTHHQKHSSADCGVAGGFG
jgi:hypothetical protein